MNELSYKISARDIEIFAYHGVLPEEKENGQSFLVDFDLELDRDSFPDSDDLDHTVDYASVVEEIVRIVGSGKHDLLETVARSILDYLLSLKGARSSSVTVKKPQAPLPVKTGWIGVTLASKRVE
ncbi:MAG: dihydroneopterin aldolase [Actinobacteria bacterium]|nr:dihydroneopterin aldolase [Actinomycetota bacterium]